MEKETIVNGEFKRQNMAWNDWSCRLLLVFRLHL